MHDIAHTSHLAAALQAEVAHVHPSDRLAEVLDRAHRPGLWLIALALTVALLLTAASLLLIAHQGDVPAQPTTRYQEA